MLMQSNSEEETLIISQKIAERLKNGGIILLEGNLGTGKTIIAKGIATYFGINKFSIKSPTYTYYRKYPLGNRHLIHMDLYRIMDIDELMLLEIQELMENERNIVVIEWAERLKNITFKNNTKVKISRIDRNRREIKVS